MNKAWTYLRQFGLEFKLISSLVVIGVIARLLSPEEYHELFEVRVWAASLVGIVASMVYARRNATRLSSLVEEPRADSESVTHLIKFLAVSALLTVGLMATAYALGGISGMLTVILVTTAAIGVLMGIAYIASKLPPSSSAP